MTDTAEKKKNKKPFKQTRSLIRLALNDGWTQNEIAEKCRDHQSIVSAWKNGSKQSTEQQLKPLLEIYGHKLRRNTFKLYCNINNETQERQYIKIEGKVVLSADIPHRTENTIIRGIPLPSLRIVVHHQGDDKFRLILQQRSQLRGTHQRLKNSPHDAIWSSTVHEQRTIKDLINYLEEFSTKLIEHHDFDASFLPFNLRQALLNHGFTLDDIVEMPADW
jgi:transcriptional regulator with XRE-family HTH domain